MEVKLFEIRDEGTHIDVLAIRLEARTEQEAYLFSRSGYGHQPLDGLDGRGYVALWRMDGGTGNGSTDPFKHDGGRTVRDAHLFIYEHWDELESGAVVDVQFIAGETAAPKKSDRYWMRGDVEA